MLVVLAAWGNGGAFANGPVRIAAEVMNARRDRQPTTVTVINSQGDTLLRRTSTKAHFHMRVPAKDRYMIRFDRPGCRSKQITVDAQEVMPRMISLKGRRVRFGVALEHDPQAELHYARPVGHIEVGQAGRTVQVEYDYALIRGAR